MRIGFIGIGAMGSPIVRHLLAGGHQVALFSRRVEAAVPLVALGAERLSSPAQVAAASDLVFTMVTGTADVEAVLFGPGGVAEGAHPGLLIVDMSTIDPAAARAFPARLTPHGVDILDAPVSGGPDGAERGALTIMCGGPADVYERVRPVMALFGANLFHLGPHGAGQSTKACHQLLLLITAEGAAEALALAARSGVDPEQARQVMLCGVASSRVLERFGARMVSRDFVGGIATRLYRKDLGIVFAAAAEAGVALPAGQVVREHITQLLDDERGEDDLSVLITVVEPPA